MAEPAGHAHEASIDECIGCGGRIIRLALPGAAWRHDNESTLCPPRPVTDDRPFDAILKGEQP